jgi:hypothetical protein
LACFVGDEPSGQKLHWRNRGAALNIHVLASFDGMDSTMDIEGCGILTSDNGSGFQQTSGKSGGSSR